MGAGVSVLSFLESRGPRLLDKAAVMNVLFPFKGKNRVTIENNVDKKLQRAKEDDKYRHKILLLGAGEAGKSTVMKQIKAINKIAITKEEMMQYTINIRRNCVEAIQTLLLVAGELGDELDNQDLMGDVERILSVDLSDARDELTPELGQCINRMWKDIGVQEVYSKREFFHLMDSTDYYLDEIERISEPNYVPTEEDMILTRVRTTGMVTSDIKDGPFTYQIVDVGGQRSERRKWIHYFDDVRSIIFLEGLSGYNQVLFEDTTMNRMKESLALFEEIMKMNVFAETPVFVFLNKKDLFEEMITRHPLTKCFPEYTGPEGEQLPALEFIRSKYTEVYKKYRGENDENLFVQILAARVRMDMKVAFNEVKETLKRLFPIKGEQSKSNKLR